MNRIDLGREYLKRWEDYTGAKASISEGNSYLDGFSDGYGARDERDEDTPPKVVCDKEPYNEHRLDENCINPRPVGDPLYELYQETTAIKIPGRSSPMLYQEWLLLLAARLKSERNSAVGSCAALRSQGER